MEKSEFVITDEFLIKVASFEGYRSSAYLCPSGKLTIGYGHTDGVKKGDKMSTDQAFDVLYADMLYIAHLLFKYLDCSAYTQLQMYCLMDFVFNLGFGRLQKSSCWDSLKCYSSVTPAVRQHLDTVIVSTILKYDKYRKNGVLTRSEGLYLRRQFDVRCWNNKPIYK